MPSLKMVMSIGIGYSNYDRPSETQEICAYGKGDAKRLHPGLHTWSVRSVDNAGNSVETEIRRFLVKTSSGSFSSSGAGWGDVQTQDQPGFSQGEWFPVSILQIGNRSYTNELSTLSPRMFSVEDPISITTPNPTFYGIAVSGSKITLTLDKEYYDLSTKTTKQEQVAKQVTTANDSSEWGINLTDNVVTLAEYTTEERLHYFVTVTVEKDGKFALIKDVPLILNVSSGSTPAAQGAPSNVLKDKVESTASNSGTVTDKLSQRKLTPSPTPLPAVQPETGSPWSGIRRWFRSLF